MVGIYDGGKDPVPRVLWWWQGSGTKGPVMVERIRYQGSCDGGKDPVPRVLWWWQGSRSCDGGKGPILMMVASTRYLWWCQCVCSMANIYTAGKIRIYVGRCPFLIWIKWVSKPYPHENLSWSCCSSWCPYLALQMDFMALFAMGTGGHYITMLPADWLISTSHDPFALQLLWWKILWNPSLWHLCVLTFLCPVHSGRVGQTWLCCWWHTWRNDAHQSLRMFWVCIHGNSTTFLLYRKDVPTCVYC